MIYKRPESVLVVVYTLDGHVLLLRRIQPKDFWQSVTGSLKSGESPLEAASRELSEETGLSSQGLCDCHQSHAFVIYPHWRHHYAPGVTQNREYVFRLAVPVCREIELDTTEHDAYLWLPKFDAAAQVQSYTNRDAIEQWVPEAKNRG
jgi:dATP pyrophosphohydrolase